MIHMTGETMALKIGGMLEKITVFFGGVTPRTDASLAEVAIHVRPPARSWRLGLSRHDGKSEHPGDKTEGVRRVGFTRSGLSAVVFGLDKESPVLHRWNPFCSSRSSARICENLHNMVSARVSSKSLSKFLINRSDEGQT